MPPVNLPVIQRTALDNSILGVLGRCPRLAFYNYVLDRSGTGTNFPISFGNMYHTFRDVLEKSYQKVVLQDGKKLSEVDTKLFDFAYGRAMDGWEDPPAEHKKSYLDAGRARKTCDQAFANWLEEKALGAIIVLSTETPYELTLPGFVACIDPACGWELRGDKADAFTGNECPHCTNVIRRRKFLGKIDQTLTWNNRFWFRDFKTTGRNEDFNKKFNPDHQFSGYAWATSVLNGNRRIEGGIIENVYNIKTKGPEFIPTYAPRSRDDITHWLEWVHDGFDEWERRHATDSWVMRTSSCGDYGGCYFRNACNTGNWGTIEMWLRQNTIHSHWDPLNPDLEAGLPEG